MKKILLMFICGAAALFYSCKDGGSENPDFRLYQAEVADVTATAASVTCRAAFDLEEYAGVGKGFVYGPAAQEIDSYTVATPPPAVKGNTLSGRLTGLTPATEYRVCAFIDLGASRVYGEAAAFRTTRVAGDEPVLEITGATTMTASAEGGSFTITYKVYNAAGGATVGASSNQEWVRSFDVSTPERVAFTVEVNPGAERQAIVTLTYPGAESCAVTLVQAAAGAVQPAEPTFGTPSHTSVTESQASVSCSFFYDGEEPLTAVYFAYKLAGGAEQQVAVTTAAGDKSTALTGLAASTTYTYRLAVEIGDRSYSSATASFTTASGGGQTGGARYSGWAELPVEVEKSGDFYYAYHMRADSKSVRNFSICYSAAMRCAVWTAAPMHTCYDGSAGRNDSWQYDPVIPQSVQPNLKNSYKGGYSRGHMVASSDRQVSVSTNRQTFYFTNMAPQYQNHFNGGIWEKLEKWCLSQRCSDTLYVVTGAHFANTNRTCSDKSGATVVVPTHFYKILMRSKSGNTRKPLWELSSDQIECVGFWFEHNESYATTEKPTSKYMKSVAEIERLTGFTFYPNVPNAPKETFNANYWGM